MTSNENTSIQYWESIRIGKAKKVLEDFNGAIEAYSKAIEINKNKYNAYFYRGNIYSKIKNHDYAITDYTEALRIKKSNFCTDIILERRDKELLEKFKINKA
tara:strand:- start:222 stop:527 length:306 start_codon:yes stop_codon:yes gene_type:complete